ncbi:MAG TPA: MFS transporter [Gaiellaceae bacterium]|nr:MFS transporter [Gaiellaceae bacterium]
MTESVPSPRRERPRSPASRLASTLWERLRVALGGDEHARVILVLAAVLGLSGADTATVGASATELRHGLHIDNTDVGLLVAVTALVGAAASIPFGVLADRVRRTWTLALAISLWAAAMAWSAAAGSFGDLLLSRVFLGVVTAAAGPIVASMVGDYFDSAERGRVYGFILAGELVGAGFGFAVTGDVAAASWRAAFVVLAIPAIILAWFVFKLPEPIRADKRAEEEPDLTHETDAQELAREHGIEPDESMVPRRDVRRMGIVSATRYVLKVRTNTTLILASALGYYFLAGIQTFGVEFATEQYGIDQALANVLLLVIGIGAVLGVIGGGMLGDRLVRRRVLNGRIVTASFAALLTTIFFVPALFSRSAGSAVPYLLLAVLFLSAQNPPLDAARLDIIPAGLWGRAEAIRTLLRALAQALAPLLFGAVSDYVFGGGRFGLQWTFVLMLFPLGASALLLWRSRVTYPRDVATAAEVMARTRPPRAEDLFAD